MSIYTRRLTFVVLVELVGAELVKQICLFVYLNVETWLTARWIIQTYRGLYCMALPLLCRTLSSVTRVHPWHGHA